MLLGSPWWGRPAPKRRLMRRRPARGRMMLRASILMCEIRLKFNVEVREMERESGGRPLKPAKRGLRSCYSLNLAVGP